MVGPNSDIVPTSHPEFTSEMETELKEVLSKKPEFVVLTAFKITITRDNLSCLEDQNWLNEEVINMYMNLLMERGKTDSYPSVYCFNTFFYTKLSKTGHAGLVRWTKNVDIFSVDLIVIPIHLYEHWSVAFVDFRSKVVKYYDSIGFENEDVIELIFTYLKEEHLDKKKVDFDTKGWRQFNVEDGPQQENDSDCGIFVCATAEHLCRDIEPTYTQDHIPYLRKKITYEIIKQRLLT